MSRLLDERSPRYPGWRVVAACFVMASFCWGFGFYGHGVYLAELQKLHGWPASLISTASTAYYLFSAGLVVFVSDMVARLGPRRFVLSGVACLAASTALLAAVDAVWQLFGVYLIMSLGWAALSVAAITNILGLWFERRRGLAISLALTGASMGGIVVVPALVFLTEAAGFARASVIAAAAMVVVLAPMVVAWIGWPAVAPASLPGPGRPDGAPPPAAAWTRRAALASFRFWTASAPFALALLAQVGFLVHQIAILEPTVGRAGAGIAVAVTALAAVVGRLGLGAAIDRLDQRMTTAVSLLSQAVALSVVIQTTDAAVLFAACVLFGLSVGNVITLPALIIQREFEAASFGMLIGLSTAISQVTYAFGPGLLGLARDLAGGYAASLALCIALEVAAAVIVLLPRLRRRADRRC